jgi:hypothetical protein
MATLYLVSHELVQKTNDLLARVRRDRGTRELMQDWVTRMDASEVLLQPVAEQNTEPGAEPATVAEGEPYPGFVP